MEIDQRYAFLSSVFHLQPSVFRLPYLIAELTIHVWNGTDLVVPILKSDPSLPLGQQQKEDDTAVNACLPFLLFSLPLSFSKSHCD